MLSEKNEYRSFWTYYISDVVIIVKQAPVRKSLA